MNLHSAAPTCIASRPTSNNCIEAGAARWCNKPPFAGPALPPGAALPRCPVLEVHELSPPNLFQKRRRSLNYWAFTENGKKSGAKPSWPVRLLSRSAVPLP